MPNQSEINDGVNILYLPLDRILLCGYLLATGSTTSLTNLNDMKMTR